MKAPGESLSLEELVKAALLLLHPLPRPGMLSSAVEDRRRVASWSQAELVFKKVPAGSPLLEAGGGLGVGQEEG